MDKERRKQEVGTQKELSVKKILNISFLSRLFQQRTISKLTMRDQFIIFFDSIFVSDKTIKLK